MLLFVFCGCFEYHLNNPLENYMNALYVRIENLPPMRVASVRIFSTQPELQAWEKLKAWAVPRGFFCNPQQHPIFGFNNPNPSKENNEYGYELWMLVGSDVVSDGHVEVKEVEGGRYAVLTVNGFPNPQNWRQLWDWVHRNNYQWRNAHELERMHNPLASAAEACFDLYLPIEGQT